jgi:hypothetical protein
MTRYVVDPDRSTVSAVARPSLGDGPGATVVAVSGTVDVADDRASGSITVTLAGDPPPTADIDLAGTRAELSADLDPSSPDGSLVLQGRTSRAAGAFGFAGPPLLNPTVLLRWRLVLAPA